eukprot:CAMPEP_0178919390 /NCGR_PEP_ID=MMETSP0786-20121207/14408_1 /TAXON_ID=186022 /ORGANISM="Thalassionema frauenfeldii, Strain CCMP 1798" /LENGTH=356 /DNA_ID=CAMNT_0020593311 /DNA_START=108 /DNA_END=1178 /DNA_ORIENTATION=-
MKRVLQSNPILEAFGNAQTLRNDNSSRFGKLTELQFDWSPSSSQRSSISSPPPLAGSICTTYLLEKSRVVGQSKGERNYHVFYQLVSCDNRELKEWVWKELIQEDVSFACLNYTSNSKEEFAQEWTQTLEALEVFGFTGESLRTLLRALCCVLQLSNIQFDEEALPDNPELEGPTVITSRDELNKLEDILGIDPLFLQEAMTKRNMKVGMDVVKKQLSPRVAKESCNALAKEIYARLFSVLVSSINEKTKGNNKRHRRRRRRKSSKKQKKRDSMGSRDSIVSGKQQRRRGSNDDSSGSSVSSIGTSSNHFGVICLLDIFGFERFDVNRFEQMCINYANEHLQNKYVVDNFGRIQKE